MNRLEGKNLEITHEDVAVRDASFSLPAGEIHVLMGPNGSGKSTLVNALAGHPKYTITKGTIILNEVDITNMSPDEKARKGLFISMQNVPAIEGVTLVQFLYQAYKSMNGGEMSILEFNTRAQEKAQILNITPELLKRPLHAGLSGGEKKQSEILQLVILEPSFALLDEIDSGVDVDSLKKVYKGVEILKESGTGLLLVTHYTNILQHITPDHIYIMKEGNIIRQGGNELVTEIAEKGFQ